MGSLPDCVPGKSFGCGRLARSSRVGSRDARGQQRSNALRRGLLPAAEVRFSTRNSAVSFRFRPQRFEKRHNPHVLRCLELNSTERKEGFHRLPFVPNGPLILCCFPTERNRISCTRVHQIYPERPQCLAGTCIQRLSESVVAVTVAVHC